MATSSNPTLPQPSPAVDAAANPSGTTSSETPKRPGARFPRWILFVVLAVLLIAGAAGYLLFLRHRAEARPIHSSEQNATSRTGSTKVAASTPTVELPLDPFVVNLADPSGHGFARIGLTLRIAAPPAAAEKSEKPSGASGDAEGSRDMVRDTIITVLNREQSADLLAPGGKENLKQAIRAAVALRAPQVKVVDIYFTEFLIQQ